MHKNGAERLLREIGWFSRQPADFQIKLLRNAELVVVEPDEMVFNAGDPPSGVYGIADGSIGAFIPSPSSGLRLATLLRSGVWFGYGPLFTGEARALTFKAFEKTWLLKVSLATLRQISLEDREARFHLASLADQATLIATRIVHDLLIRQTKRRVAATLIRVAGDVDGNVKRGKLIRLSQSALAEMANTSRQSANQVLRELEIADWIKITYEHVQLRDPKSVKDFAFSGG